MGGLPEDVSCEHFLKYFCVFFSAMCMFAKELNVQPTLSPGIGSDEAAAVCPELCRAKTRSAMRPL